MIETPVGYRCAECAIGPRVAAYRTTNLTFIRAMAVGMLVAFAVGFLWGNFPAWGFYTALLMGFGTVEAMARAANYKRGGDLMVAAFGAILIGLLVSRYTIILVNPQNVPVPLSVNFVIDNINEEFVRRIVYLRPIPDFLFMAIPFFLAYIRFR